MHKRKSHSDSKSLPTTNVKKAHTKTKTKQSASSPSSALIKEFAELLPAGELKKLKKSASGKTSDHLLQFGAFKTFPIFLRTDGEGAADGEDNQLKYLFIRKLKEDEDQEFSTSSLSEVDRDRTLLVANLVYDATEEDVRTIFSALGGTVSQIKFVDLTEPDFSQRICLVEFELATSADQFLNMKQSEALKLRLFEKGFVRGMEKWLAEFKLSRPDPEVLQKQVDEFMLEYDRREAQRRKEREKLASEPDADGFVTVVRRGRKMTTDGKVAVQAVRASDVKVVSAEQRALSDFYRFQRREAQREQLETLQKRFEEDKQRIAKMKHNRKFKPY